MASVHEVGIVVKIGKFIQVVPNFVRFGMENVRAVFVDFNFRFGIGARIDVASEMRAAVDDEDARRMGLGGDLVGFLNGVLASTLNAFGGTLASEALSGRVLGGEALRDGSTKDSCADDDVSVF